MGSLRQNLQGIQSLYTLWINQAPSLTRSQNLRLVYSSGFWLSEAISILKEGAQHLTKVKCCASCHCTWRNILFIWLSHRQHSDAQAHHLTLVKAQHLTKSNVAPLTMIKEQCSVWSICLSPSKWSAMWGAMIDSPGAKFDSSKRNSGYLEFLQVLKLQWQQWRYVEAQELTGASFDFLYIHIYMFKAQLCYIYIYVCI